MGKFKNRFLLIIAVLICISIHCIHLLPLFPQNSFFLSKSRITIHFIFKHQQNTQCLEIIHDNDKKYIYMMCIMMQYTVYSLYTLFSLIFVSTNMFNDCFFYTYISLSILTLSFSSIVPLSLSILHCKSVHPLHFSVSPHSLFPLQSLCLSLSCTVNLFTLYISLSIHTLSFNPNIICLSILHCRSYFSVSPHSIFLPPSHLPPYPACPFV